METAVYAGIGLASLYGIIQMNVSICSLQKELTTIINTPVYHPSTLLEDITKNTETIKKYFRSSDSEITGKVFLEGYLQTQYPISSVIDKKNLIYSLFYRDKIYSNDKQLIEYPRKTKIPKHEKPIKQSSPIFQLKDFEKNEQFCKIYKNLDIKFLGALQLITSKPHFKSLTLSDRICILIGRIAEFFNALSHTNIKFKGITIGYQEIELGLKLNSIVTAFGEVIYNKITKTLEMKNPEYFLKDKSLLITALNKKLMNLLFLRQLRIMLKNYMQKKEQAKRDELNKIKSLMIEEMRCTICQENLRNIILKPCHHLTMCNQCCTQLIKKQCPVCRKKITGTVEIFIS